MLAYGSHPGAARRGSAALGAVARLVATAAAEHAFEVRPQPFGAARGQSEARPPQRMAALDVALEAAADLDCRAGHVAVLFGDEEGGGVADFLELGPAAEQRLACEALTNLLRRRAADLGHRLCARSPRLGLREAGA